MQVLPKNKTHKTAIEKQVLLSKTNRKTNSAAVGFFFDSLPSDSKVTGERCKG
jgi:hypothetical protein